MASGESGDGLDEQHLRIGVFQWLSERTDGGQLPVSFIDARDDCTVGGQRVSIIGMRGIWQPRGFEYPVSIRTAAASGRRPRPYDDQISDDGLLEYAYFQDNPAHRDNVGLRRAMRDQIPLVYFHGVAEGVYLATWPVHIVADHPELLRFDVLLADPGRFRPDLSPEMEAAAEANYYATLTKRRLHQADFRTRVLAAYRTQCGFCRLRHPELLDAAHIRPDAQGGQPVTSNGLSLCKIHHAAFDHNIVGLRPDFRLEVRSDVLEEVDGPMLRYGIQELHGQSLLLPRRSEDQPDRVAVEERYERFAGASR